MRLLSGRTFMRNLALLATLLMTFALSWSTLADDAKPGDKAVPAAEAKRIDELIKQLGSSKFAERNTAKKELEGLGMAALEALRQAVKSKDLETSRRASELVQKLEAKITNDAMLAPKRVRLNLKDTPALDAIAKLQKQSGYQIQVAGDRSGLANKKITLDTGETTFWEALDQLCRAAGLTQTAPAAQQVPPGFPAFQAVPAVPGVLPRLKPLPPPPLPAPGVLPVVPPPVPAPPQILQVQL